MKKKLLLFGFLATAQLSWSQQTLLSDNFETGSANWTLNGGIGDNGWVINNHYLAGSLSTLGVTDTPSQTVGITPSNSNYLHITSQTICTLAGMFGPTTNCNANFQVSNASDQNATLSTPINATNMTGVTISFWYLAGGDLTAFGKVEYSIDGGTNWTQIGADLHNQNSWTQLSLTSPTLDNQASVLFRFNWNNIANSTGANPAFAVDNVVITGTSGSGGTTPGGGTQASTIAGSSISPNAICYAPVGTTSQTTNVNFTATGTINSGNLYIAQLSDANGSFTIPVSIGVLNSTATGNLTINATIPAGTPAGTGYKIRVIATNPSVIGTSTGQDLTIHTLPVISITGNPANGQVYVGNTATLTASGANTYVWSPSNVVANPNTASVVVTPTQSVVMTVVGTDNNGCQSTQTFDIKLVVLGIDEMENNPFEIYPNPAKNFVSIKAANKEQISQVTFAELQGKTIKTVNTAFDQIDIQDLNTGAYLLKIETANHTYSQKVIIH